MSEAESKPAAPVVRALSAAEVAARTGWKKREVLTWPGRGCPCDWTVRRQQRSPNFNLEETLAWRVKIGADVYKPGSDQDPRRQPTLADAAKAPPTTTPPPPPRSRSDGASVDDLGDRVQQLRIKLEDLCAQDTSRMDPAASQKFATALKPLSSELRELEKHEMEMARKRRELIDRLDAQRMLVALASGFTSALESLIIDLPAKVWRSVAPVEAAWKDVEEFARIAGAVLESEAAAVRESLARELERLSRGEESDGPIGATQPPLPTLEAA